MIGRIPEDERNVMRARKVVKRMFDTLGWRKNPQAKRLAAGLVGPLDEILDQLRRDGVFGPDGICDPRGDFRNGDWSLKKRVSGVDR
jgi:hypothetical protein